MSDDTIPRIVDLAERIEDLEDALVRIEGWCKAYPVDFFSPLTSSQIEVAASLLKAHGIDIGALHAQWARHLLEGIGEMAHTALEQKQETEP